MRFLLFFLSFSCLICILCDGCNWYGEFDNLPLYPMDVCANSVFENEIDGYNEFSYKYECVNENEMQILYHNTTDCSGTPFNVTTRKKSDADYYFNCDNKGMCPYVKMKFTELFNTTDEHSCDIDPHNFQEFSLITDTCWDFPYYSNITHELIDLSYYVDCSASKVLFELFFGKSCKMSNMINSTTVKEGCDDPFDYDLYFQVVECEDSQFETTDGGHHNNSSDSESNNLAIIFTVVIAVIVITVGVMVAVAIIRKKKQAQAGYVSGGLQGSGDLAKPIAFERLEDDNNDGGDSNMNSDALSMDDAADQAR